MRKIRHRSSGEVLFEYKGLLRNVDLKEAYLHNADLNGFNLRGADLRKANLIFADLRGANLRGARLQGADLRCANLFGADLKDANLEDADIDILYMESRNFREVRNLPSDFIKPHKQGFMKTIKLFRTNGEVPFLRKALLGGKVNGTQYHGDCACLVGTLANARKEYHKDLSERLGYTEGLQNPAELWFWQIKEGDTPKSNIFSRLAVAWCNEIIAADKKRKKK